ncbi:MAG: L-threonylcarbamoyladenylate synthase [Halothiobacillaceae bacterium]
MPPAPFDDRCLPAWQLRRAARWLRQGGIVAYPTEAVFGLGCDPQNSAALRALLALKQRAWQKGLILIADDVVALSPYLVSQPEHIHARALARWPGATTWLWPARPQVSPLLRGVHQTLAVRIPAHPVARALSRAFGHALVSTSANRSGQSPARSALEVRRKLGARTSLLILHGQVNRRARPSQILDLHSGKAVRS